MSSTKNSKYIHASPEKIYKAFTDPAALEVWQAPGNMTGKVHQFDLRVGGGYEMSLYYPASEKGAPGKSADKEDRFRIRFEELVPNKKIVQSAHFDSPDPAFAGKMMMELTLEPKDGGTLVTLAFSNIPPGIRPEDNEAGTASSLEKLAHYVE
jgi:uncharacterized protein YndB with AHSA1/START domain